MFRDLKEYQDIAKIYADKVSKPENLEERRGSDLSQAEIQKNREGFKNTIMTGNPEGKKPVNTSQSNRRKLSQQRSKQNKGRVEKQFGFLKPKPRKLKDGQTSVRQSGANTRKNIKPEVKKFPSTAEIRAANQGRVGGGNAGASTDSGGTQGQGGAPEVKTPDPKPQSTFIKRDKGVGFVKRGTAPAKRAENIEKNKNRAKEMAKARIAAKKEGTASTPMSGKERAQAMAKARLAKKAAMANEEFTPYDIVLEYLLSSEQVATIEEANYVMTEMDAETIQGIVEMQGQINRADIIGGTQAAKNAAAGKGKYTPGKGVTKDFKLDPAFKLPKV